MSIFPVALTADQVHQQYVAAGGFPGDAGSGVSRIAGDDRFGTAATIAESYPAGLDTVYAANGLNFPDQTATAWTPCARSASSSSAAPPPSTTPPRAN
ncbi:MAG: cell wall-binding repeat-containing protein [Actinobacteria bacterium]|nr:cell wall-binding repeat-containing protein [Actinomycetota bacterium]